MQYAIYIRLEFLTFVDSKLPKSIKLINWVALIISSFTVWDKKSGWAFFQLEFSGFVDMHDLQRHLQTDLLQNKRFYFLSYYARTF